MTDNPEEEKKNSFVFYESWYDGAQYLNGKHRLIYYEAIIKLGLFGEETELKGIENALFSAIKPTIKFNKKQKANGLKGGANQGNSNARKTTQKQPKNNPNSTNYINDVDSELYLDLYGEPSKEGEGDTPAPASEEFLETFGILGNVKMKAAEYRHLVEDYGEDITKETVDDLSCKLADGSVDSSNHYATLLSWLRYQRRSGGPVPMSSSQPQPKETNEEFVIRIAWQALTDQEKKDYMDTHGGKTLIETKGAI